MVGWIPVVTMVAVAAAPLPPAGARTAIELDALATLRYKSAQTETVAARVADAQLTAMRAKIDSGDRRLAATRGQLATLRAGARADKAKIATLQQQADALIAELAALKNGFTDELAARDAQYARDIAVLQTAGEQLLATPEGLRALELYNQGGPGAFEAADAVLGAGREGARPGARGSRQEAARRRPPQPRDARARRARQGPDDHRGRDRTLGGGGRRRPVDALGLGQARRALFGRRPARKGAGRERARRGDRGRRSRPDGGAGDARTVPHAARRHRGRGESGRRWRRGGAADRGRERRRRVADRPCGGAQQLRVDAVEERRPARHARRLWRKCRSARRGAQERSVQQRSAHRDRRCRAPSRRPAIGRRRRGCGARHVCQRGRHRPRSGRDGHAGRSRRSAC